MCFNLLKKTQTRDHLFCLEEIERINRRIWNLNSILESHKKCQHQILAKGDVTPVSYDTILKLILDYLKVDLVHQEAETCLSKQTPESKKR